jgi:hypothetical protein
MQPPVTNAQAPRSTGPTGQLAKAKAGFDRRELTDGEVSSDVTTPNVFPSSTHV